MEIIYLYDYFARYLHPYTLFDNTYFLIEQINVRIILKKKKYEEQSEYPTHADDLIMTKLPMTKKNNDVLQKINK